MANVARIPEWNRGHPLFRKSQHKPAPERAVTEAAKAAARHTDPRIDIRIFKRPAVAQDLEHGEYWAEIRFYSHVQPNYAMRGEIEMSRKTERDMDFEVGITCGAMAERLDEIYGDGFDPERSAREGSRKWAELLKEWGRKDH